MAYGPRDFFHTTSAMKQTGLISPHQLNDSKDSLNLSETIQKEDSSALTGLKMNHLKSMALGAPTNLDMLQLLSPLVTTSIPGKGSRREEIMFATNASQILLVKSGTSET